MKKQIITFAFFLSTLPLNAVKIIVEGELSALAEFKERFQTARVRLEGNFSTLDEVDKQLSEEEKQRIVSIDHSFTPLISFLPLLQCTQLRVLDLSHSGLEELPSSIGSFSHLSTLRLQHNNLTELPPTIGDLSSLKTFDVSDNNITLPSFILNWPYLSYSGITTDSLLQRFKMLQADLRSCAIHKKSLNHLLNTYGMNRYADRDLTEEEREAKRQRALAYFHNYLPGRNTKSAAKLR